MHITFWYSDNPEHTFAVTLHKLSWEKFTTLLLATVSEIKSCILFSDQIPECGERVSFIPIAIYPHFFSKTMLSQLGVYITEHERTAVHCFVLERQTYFSACYGSLSHMATSSCNYQSKPVT